MSVKKAGKAAVTVRRERVLVSLTARGRQAAMALGKATGKPVATIIGDMVEEAAPMLESLARAAEEMKSKRGNLYGSLAVALAEAQVSAANTALDLHKSAHKAVKRGR